MPPLTILSVEEELALGVEISIISLLDSLIEEAHRRRASDIHLDPSISGVSVRLRIDGVLQGVYTIPHEIRDEVISRIKVLAGLRTDEHQAAQDGRFRHHLRGEHGAGAHIDVRVSIAPTYHGENAVMRLLADRSSSDYSLEALGMSAPDRAKIEKALERRTGMILATGPTGSGKTTTLYTLIKMLNSSEVSIITIEDPIEYSVEGVEQIQVNQKSGLTFANGLRSILRQDPDIIMVGEIRDAETAGIAVNTALTGHLLLSTLHTSDAATTLPRLTDMGIDPYLVASTINVAIGQRLVRTICEECKESRTVSSELAEALKIVPLESPVKEGETFFAGAGCESCGGTGYRGRVGINEVLVADPIIRDAILRKAPSSELKRLAVAGGMTTMLEDGFEKARRGMTTIEEVLRVVHE
jgi:type II secretory ATPase GspE/PulE/Tfp pilus assembly ATPase PilB-like protein